MKLTLNIDPKVIEQIEANHDEIEAAVRRAAKSVAAKGKGEIEDWFRLDWKRIMRESSERAIERDRRSRRIRIVLDEPPYIGGGIITGTHKRR